MSMYGITRIDNGKTHTHSWVVLISRKNRKHFGSFSDAVYGGKKKALSSAKKYRDEILSQYDPVTLKEFCCIVKKSNKSGIPGVYRCKSNEPDKEGNCRAYWIASWPTEPGKSKQIKFSIKKYGEEEAFHKAVLARQEALEHMKGYFNPRRKANE